MWIHSGPLTSGTAGAHPDALYDLLENDGISLDRTTNVHARDIHEAARTKLQLDAGQPPAMSSGPGKWLSSPRPSSTILPP